MKLILVYFTHVSLCVDRFDMLAIGTWDSAVNERVCLSLWHLHANRRKSKKWHTNVYVYIHMCTISGNK